MYFDQRQLPPMRSWSAFNYSLELFIIQWKYLFKGNNYSGESSHEQEEWSSISMHHPCICVQQHLWEHNKLWNSNFPGFTTSEILSRQNPIWNWAKAVGYHSRSCGKCNGGLMMRDSQWCSMMPPVRSRSIPFHWHFLPLQWTFSYVLVIKSAVQCLVCLLRSCIFVFL